MLIGLHYTSLFTKLGFCTGKLPLNVESLGVALIRLWQELTCLCGVSNVQVMRRTIVAREGRG